MAPLIKIWRFALKSPSSDGSVSNDLQQVLTDVLTLCNSYSNTLSSSQTHTFWQDTQNPQNLVMLTGYPSQETTDTADSEFLKTLAPRLFQFVENKGLWQLEGDVADVPKNEVLSVESALMPETEVGSFDKKQSDVWAPGKTVAGWDVWKQSLRKKKGEEPLVDGEERTWVRVTGWNSGSDGLNSLQAKSSIGEVVVLKKLMG